MGDQNVWLKNKQQTNNKNNKQTTDSLFFINILNWSGK